MSRRGDMPARCTPLHEAKKCFKHPARGSAPGCVPYPHAVLTHAQQSCILELHYSAFTRHTQPLSRIPRTPNRIRTGYIHTLYIDAPDEILLVTSSEALHNRSHSHLAKSVPPPRRPNLPHAHGSNGSCAICAVIRCAVPSGPHAARGHLESAGDDAQLTPRRRRVPARPR